MPCSSAAAWDESLFRSAGADDAPRRLALRDGRIVMRTADPALSAAAAKALAASFEFDEIRNEDHRAWNVIVTGELEALDDEGLDGRGVNAWAPSEDERSIALRIADVSGREVPEPHVPPTSSRLTSFEEVEATTPDTDPDGDGIDPWGQSGASEAGDPGAVRTGVPVLVPVQLRAPGANPDPGRRTAGRQPRRGGPH